MKVLLTMNNTQQQFDSAMARAKGILRNPRTTNTNIDQLLDAINVAVDTGSQCAITDEQRVDLVMRFAAIPERSNNYAHMGRMLTIGKKLSSWAHDPIMHSRLQSVQNEVILIRELTKGSVVFGNGVSYTGMRGCKCYVDFTPRDWVDLVHDASCKHAKSSPQPT